MTKMTERLQRLRKAGFESWDDAVHSTTDLTPAAAAELLGVTPKSIRAARATRGLKSKVPVVVFDPDDPADPLHGMPGYHRGCRCLRCRSANAQRLARWRAERVLDPSSFDHGLSGYRGRGCRCPTCKEAWRDHKRQLALKEMPGVEHGSGYEAGCRCLTCRMAAGKPLRRRVPKNTPMSAQDSRHGTNAGYRAGCRCARCRAGQAAYNAQYRARKSA